MFIPNSAADNSDRNAPSNLEDLSIDVVARVAFDDEFEGHAWLVSHSAEMTATGVISTIISGLANPVTVTRVLAGQSSG